MQVFFETSGALFTLNGKLGKIYGFPKVSVVKKIQLLEKLCTTF